MVLPAAGVEGGTARRTGIAAFEVVADRNFCAAGAAEDHTLVPFRTWPSLYSMTGERRVAVHTRVPGVAALHADRNDVARRMVMRAARLQIDIEAENGRNRNQVGLPFANFGWSRFPQSAGTCRFFAMNKKTFGAPPKLHHDLDTVILLFSPESGATPGEPS